MSSAGKFCVRAAFPTALECNSEYYGYDLPAFGAGSAGASAGKVLINSRPDEYSTKCGAKGSEIPMFRVSIGDFYHHHAAATGTENSLNRR